MSHAVEILVAVGIVLVVYGAIGLIAWRYVRERQDRRRETALLKAAARRAEPE